MDTEIEYKLMCYKAKEIQDSWNPTKGDYMVSVATYCCDAKSKCNEKNVCKQCLEMSNVYVVSGETYFVEEIGGRHWFFGGHPCVRGSGHMMNGTSCYVMTKTGHSEVVDNFNSSSQDKMLWLPRQDQIQAMFWDGLCEHAKVRHFIKWLDTASYSPYTDTLEMLWLMCYMNAKYNKKWNETSNVKEWE
jgi:hypothetical protein